MINTIAFINAVKNCNTAGVIYLVVDFCNNVFISCNADI